VADDPHTGPVTGVLLNKLRLGTAAELEAAEREITHAALILLGEPPVHPGYDLPHLCAIHRRIFGDIYDWAGRSGRPACYLGEVNAVHPFREGNGPTQRAFFEQFAREAGCTLAWQHLDAARNIEASAAGLVHMGNRPRAATISRCRRVQ
jgi:cell filamentation protein